MDKPFTTQVGIEIQAGHLAEWCIVLKEEAYRALEKWALAGNKSASWGDEVRRGDDLRGAVYKLMQGEKLEE